MKRLAQVVTGGSEEARLGKVCLVELVGALIDLALQICVGALQLRRHAVKLLAECL